MSLRHNSSSKDHGGKLSRTRVLLVIAVVLLLLAFFSLMVNKPSQFFQLRIENSQQNFPLIDRINAPKATDKKEVALGLAMIAKEKSDKEEVALGGNPSLHPNWAMKVLESSETISFKRLEAKSKYRQLVASFFYPIEETMHSVNYIEGNELKVVTSWISIVQALKANKQSCNVLDIGSNGGYFTLLSRALNCNALAIDAQPHCLVRLSSAAAVNGFTAGLSTLWTAVSDSKDFNLTVGATKCSGLWAIQGSDWINKESTFSTTVHSMSVSEIVADWKPEGGHIAIMKIDAEGSEMNIIRSAMPLLKNRQIDHIIAEFVPGRVVTVTPPLIVIDTIDQLYSNGYQCRIIGDSTKVSASALKVYFDPLSKAAGRGNPKMYHCSHLPDPWS